MSDIYKNAGVDIHAGYESVNRIKSLITSTKSKGFSGDIGGFGGLFNLFKYGYEEPVLVSGTDGVGSKLHLAINEGKLDSVGIDLVAMCVNDILTSGAEPLFFLDYIAVHKNNPEEIENIVKGITEGCLAGSLSLIGGETAEMPSLYSEGHFDLAGFAVGVVEKNKQITGESIESGDILIGLPSSGIHSNGYSLVQKVLKENNVDLSSKFNNRLLIDELLEPTKIYVKEIQALKNEVSIKAMSHVTGGGYIENLPRMITQDNLGIELNIKDVKVPDIFNYLMDIGDIPKEEMYSIFNMGIGFVVVVSKTDVEQAISILSKFTEPLVIGEITNKKGIVIND